MTKQRSTEVIFFNWILNKEGEQKCNMLQEEISRPEEWMPLKYNLNLSKSDLQCGRRCLQWYLHCTHERMFIASWEYQGKCWNMFWLYVGLRNWYLAFFLGSRKDLENRNAKKRIFPYKWQQQTVIRKERESLQKGRVGRLAQKGPGEVERSIKMEKLLM